MRQILLILTAIIIIFCVACNTEDTDKVDKVNKQMAQETTKQCTENYEPEPLQETIETTTQEIEELMRFTYEILENEEDEVVAVKLRFEGNKSMGAVCVNLEEVSTFLDIVPCEMFIVNGVDSEIHMTKGQIIAVLRETFMDR